MVIVNFEIGKSLPKRKGLTINIKQFNMVLLVK